VARMEEECVQRFGGKARRKEIIWKTKEQMGGCDQNGSYGDSLRECTIDPFCSG
jgi:hypothetical protein